MAKRQIDLIEDSSESDEAPKPPKKAKPQARSRQKSPKKTREDKYADDHLQYIDKAYNDLADEYEATVNQLKGGVKYSKTDASKLEKDSAQLPYVNMKRALNTNQEIRPVIAEAVRIMSTGQKYNEQMIKSMMKGK